VVVHRSWESKDTSSSTFREFLAKVSDPKEWSPAISPANLIVMLHGADLEK